MVVNSIVHLKAVNLINSANIHRESEENLVGKMQTIAVRPSKNQFAVPVLESCL